MSANVTQLTKPLIKSEADSTPIIVYLGNSTKTCTFAN